MGRAKCITLIAAIVSIALDLHIPSPEQLIASLFNDLADTLRQVGIFDEHFSLPLTIATTGLAILGVISLPLTILIVIKLLAECLG